MELLSDFDNSLSETPAARANFRKAQTEASQKERALS